MFTIALHIDGSTLQKYIFAPSLATPFRVKVALIKPWIKSERKRTW